MAKNRIALRLVLVPLVVLFSAECATADVLDDWNEAMLNAIRRENTPPPLAARNLAILHVALFDAVNSIERTHKPYLTFVAPGGPASEQMAVAAAGREVSLSLFPSERSTVNALWMRAAGRIKSAQERTNSVAIGVAAAKAILEARASDGAQLVITYFPSNQPGAWRRTPPYYRPPESPNWRCLKPFAMHRCDQFRPPPPPKLDGPQYAADFNEVKSLGQRDSAVRTAYETQTALFWSDFTGTVTPPGHWNQVARAIANDRKLRLPEKARLLALLNVALADAGIVAWDAKYAFNFWRPVTAIRRATDDANPLTDPDAGWQPLLTTPPFPEYVSAHSTFSGAAATVLALFFGQDEIPFQIGSDSVPGLVRAYRSLSGAASEIGHSRILGGIHFPSADKAGRAAGRELGRYVFKNLLTEQGPLSLKDRHARSR